MTEHKANTGSFPHRFGTTELDTLVRRMIETGKDDTDPVIRSRIAIIKKQTRELEIDPDRTGLATTRLTHIRALSKYREMRAAS